MNELLNVMALPFFQRALIGGGLIALLTSFVGVQVVLRRASFFGDAIAHASLTGVALGLLFSINPLITTIIFALLVAAMLPFAQRFSRLPLDNLLGSLLPAAMALGVVLLALIPGYQPELMSFLFGNILTISNFELYWLAGLVGLGSVVFWRYQRQILLISIDEELAKTSGIKVNRVELIFHLLLALTVVASLQLVGVILINALIVMPAAIARLFARSLKSIYWLTPVISLLVVFLGLATSAAYNLPSGPMIAVLAGAGLLIGSVWARFLQSR